MSVRCESDRFADILPAWAQACGIDVLVVMEKLSTKANEDARTAEAFLNEEISRKLGFNNVKV